jgi:hypothetical protein
MSLGAFEERINLLTKMGCNIHLGTDMTHPLGELSVGKVFKTKAGKNFNKALSKDEPLMTEELTPQELSLLDQGLKAVFDNKNTPLLDSMGVLKPKLNISHEIRAYFQENPGQNANQAATNLANKLESHFFDINDAFRRIKTLINVLCTRNSPQYSLDRRGGRGMYAQIHPL